MWGGKKVSKFQTVREKQDESNMKGGDGGITSAAPLSKPDARCFECSTGFERDLWF